MRGAAPAAAALCLLLPLAAPPRAAAQPTEQRPLFEAGVFGGGGYLPDYPAAGQNHFRGLALPYLIYRGEILRSDDRGLRGRFYRGEDLEFSLSFSGALPARSRDNRAREGMPDLDFLGEVGPALRWVAWRDGAKRRVSLELPVRAVFSSDLTEVDFRGFVAAPEAAFEHVGLLHPAARTRVGIGPVFASGRFMDYFYRVEGEYVRPDRRGYDASGGYLGARLQASYRRPVTDRISVVAGGRVENFTGATNGGSPLFRREWNGAVFGGVSIALYRSAAAVESASEPFD